ncbi:MAG: hypothetical protein H6654_02645 [Ardenticatenaceae bacterium]|nr:hypothetical protein [Anaerolineales bacterium]MCB8941086.1 hypothetical protein [Ardenticatenaceae bacterium]MCB8972427.1 hypothetical protein [Ardenticatenaceae bacterium]
MTDFEPIYQSYLLRLWVVNETGEPVTRISLHNIGNGRWQTFANLEAMCAFLAEQLPNRPHNPPKQKEGK